MSKTLLSGGLIAGALAGVVVALLQLWLIQPLIIEAERYETGELALPLVQTEDQPGMSTTIQPDDMQIEGTHLSRAGLTVIFLTLTWCGFGLLAGASMSAAQMSTNVRPFSAVGIAVSGFAVAFLAPALGLPPELPGMPAANLSSRQLWWILTLVATAAGLALTLRCRVALKSGHPQFVCHGLTEFHRLKGSGRGIEEALGSNRQRGGW